MSVSGKLVILHTNQWYSVRNEAPVRRRRPQHLWSVSYRAFSNATRCFLVENVRMSLVKPVTSSTRKALSYDI